MSCFTLFCAGREKDLEMDLFSTLLVVPILGSVSIMKAGLAREAEKENTGRIQTMLAIT
jgi:hypothetical protein